MNLLDTKQIKEFKGHTEAEYKQDLVIHKYIKSRPVKRTDGKFIQIGLRPLVDIDFFDENSSYSPTIFGLGDSIAKGEESYFLRRILQYIKKIDTNSKKLTRQKLISIISKIKFLDDPIIIVPIDFQYDYMLKGEEWIRWDKEVNEFVFEMGNSKIPVYSVHNDIIKNNIIILNKNFGIWKYILFDGDKRLDIKIGNIVEGNKIDITIRSLIKFEILDKSRIQVIKLKNS